MHVSNPKRHRPLNHQQGKELVTDLRRMEFEQQRDNVITTATTDQLELTVQGSDDSVEDDVAQSRLESNSDSRA